MCQGQLVEGGGVDGRAIGGIAMLGEEVGKLLERVAVVVVVVLSETAGVVVKMSKRRPPRDVRHVGQAPVGHGRACRVPDDHVSLKEGGIEWADAILGTFFCWIISVKRGHCGRT